MKKTISNIFLTIGLLIGLSFLLYPTFSDYWNEHHQTQMIENYNEEMQNLDSNKEIILKDAQNYNQKLKTVSSRWNLSEQELDEYQNILNVGSSGMIGYLEIEKLNVRIAVYHGTDESVLQIGAGHLEGTSLPVGGEGCHSVLMGHRGLMSAKLFTDLDKMQEGDIFTVNVLGETLTYEVYTIHIVEPDDLSYLAIDDSRDLCTLITCTPYGVNTHRLLVQGERIRNRTIIHVSSEAMVISPVIVTFVVLFPVLLLIFIFFMILPNNTKKLVQKEKIKQSLLSGE